MFQFVPSVLSLIWYTTEKSLAPSLRSFPIHIRYLHTLIRSFLTLPFSRMNCHSSFSTSPWSHTLITFVVLFWTQSIFPFPFHTGKTSTGCGTSNVSPQFWVERKDPSHQLAGSTLPNAVHEVAFQGCHSSSRLICYPPGLPVLLLQSCFLVVRPKSVWVQCGHPSCIKLFLSLQPTTILILLKTCNHLSAEINNAMLNSTLYSHNYNLSSSPLAIGDRSCTAKTPLVKEYETLGT